jgi:hypothetical protein
VSTAAESVVAKVEEVGKSTQSIGLFCSRNEGTDCATRSEGSVNRGRNGRTWQRCGWLLFFTGVTNWVALSKTTVQSLSHTPPPSISTRKAQSLHFQSPVSPFSPLSLSLVAPLRWVQGTTPPTRYIRRISHTSPLEFSFSTTLASANTLSTIFASKTSLRQHSFESIDPVTGFIRKSPVHSGNTTSKSAYRTLTALLGAQREASQHHILDMSSSRSRISSLLPTDFIPR